MRTDPRMLKIRSREITVMELDHIPNRDSEHYEVRVSAKQPHYFDFPRKTKTFTSFNEAVACFGECVDNATDITQVKFVKVEVKTIETVMGEYPKP